MPQRKAVVFGSYLPSLINFRRQLLIDLQSKGYHVIAIAPDRDEHTEKELAKLKVDFICTPLARTGFNPVTDLRSLRALKKLFKTIQPDLLITYTIKPNIYGTLACNGLKTKKVAWITGLGFVGMPAANKKTKLVRQMIFKLYKKSFKKLEYIAFQNPDDQQFFTSNELLDSKTKQTITAGSGVDMAYYKKAEPILFPIIFLLVARLIKAKGLNEYLEAAEYLKSKHGKKVAFHVIGMLDVGNPDAVDEGRIKDLNAQGVIVYHGEKRDIRPYLAASSVFVLPSYYREGVPRTILEAMAMGKPIITTDNPGCRETVEEGQNGFLIPIKNKEALIKAMEHFIQNTSAISEMGEKSYQKAANVYDVHKVNAHLLSFIEA